MHVHLQQMMKSGNKPPSAREGKGAFSRQKLLHIIQHLESIIRRLKTRAPAWSIWSNYYEKTILSKSYLDEKEKLFRQFIAGIPFRNALDLGANDGYFSQPDNILAQPSYNTVAATFRMEFPHGIGLRLWGRNLTNSLIAQNLSAGQFNSVVTYGAPRTFGLTVSAKF